MLLAPLSLALSGVAAADPAPDLIDTRTRARTLECERLTPERTARTYPGQIASPGPPRDDAERSVVVCTQRVAPPGLRSDTDEAILSSLEERASELALAAASVRPDLAERTWLVEAYLPSAAVEAKVAFATKNALVRQGLGVSDRAPTLAVGDIGVLTRMEPLAAYPAACQRYAATGSVGADDALLAVLRVDPRETELHGGLCVDGHWTWLK